MCQDLQDAAQKTCPVPPSRFYPPLSFSSTLRIVSPKDSLRLLVSSSDQCGANLPSPALERKLRNRHPAHLRSTEPKYIVHHGEIVHHTMRLPNMIILAPLTIAATIYYYYQRNKRKTNQKTEYPTMLSLIHNTPLIHLPSLDKFLPIGTRILAKVEFMSPGTRSQHVYEQGL